MQHAVYEYFLDGSDAMVNLCRFSLLFSKCKLEIELYGVEPALQTCRTMLLLWKGLYEVANDW